MLQNTITPGGTFGWHANRRAGQNPVFRCRTPPSTEPFSRGVAGVHAVRVKRVVAPEREEPLVPRDLVALASRDRRAQVVIDALANHPAQPVKDPDVTLEKALSRQVEAEVRRLRPRIGQRRDQRIDPALTTGELRSCRHLTPVELQHLARAIARPLRRPDLPRTKYREPLADQDRPSPCSRSPRARSPSTRGALISGTSSTSPRNTPSSGSSIEPAGAREYRGGSSAAISLSTVLRLIPSRRAISRSVTPSACIARTSAQSTALRTSSASSIDNTPTVKADTDTTAAPRQWLTFRFLEVAHYWAPGVNGQRMGALCVEGVAGRSGALRSAAERERRDSNPRPPAWQSEAQQHKVPANTRVGRCSGLVLVTFLRSAAGRCEPHAPQTRLVSVSLQGAIDVIVLRRSDRPTAVRAHRRRRSQTRLISP